MTVEYGRYMAQVLDCVGCHTEGFSGDKMAHPRAFAGGFEFTDPTGTPIWSKNITMDPETGISCGFTPNQLMIGDEFGDDPRLRTYWELLGEISNDLA